MVYIVVHVYVIEIEDVKIVKGPYFSFLFFLVCPSSSPFFEGKDEWRLDTQKFEYCYACFKHVMENKNFQPSREKMKAFNFSKSKNKNIQPPK